MQSVRGLLWPNITKATQMLMVFDQNGLAGKPMFQTEGSWGNETITDLDTQIAWLARFNLLQAGLRASLNLQMAAWFACGGGTTFGWGDIEDASLELTAAGLAYNRVFNLVAGAYMNQPCSGAADGTWTCTLTRDGGYVARLGRKHDPALPPVPPSPSARSRSSSKGSRPAHPRP